MATPRKTSFDLGQRVRLSTAVDGLHPDGVTTLRVAPGTLVEITQINRGHSPVTYVGRYAQRVGTEWKPGTCVLEFADAGTVLGRPLFPGDMDKGIRPQDNQVLSSDKKVSSTADSQLDPESGAGDDDAENETPLGSGNQDGEGDESEDGDDPVSGGHDAEDAQPAQPQQSASPTAAPTPDEESPTMPTTATAGAPSSAEDALTKALANAAAQATAGQAEGAGQGNGGEGDTEERLTRLERIEATLTDPTREVVKKLSPVVQQAAKEAKAALNGVQGIMAPLDQYMKSGTAARKQVGEQLLGLERRIVQLEQNPVAGAAAAPTVINVKNADFTATAPAGARPELVETLRLIGMGFQNIFWVGPAGTGKTTMKNGVAQALGLEEGDVACFPGLSETIWLGRLRHNISNGTDNLASSRFTHLFEHGGVFLADEIDNSDPSTLIIINTALANGYLTLPDGRTVQRHAQFVFVAAANTWGRGADRMYVGRAQLDGATLDRFVGAEIIVGYNPNIEQGICAAAGGKPVATALYKEVIRLRQAAEKADVRRIISTRFVVGAVRHVAGGATIPQAFAACMVGWSEDDRRAVGVLA